jgi:hypothetical protein
MPADGLGSESQIEIDESLLSAFLVQRLLGKASGRLEKECLGNRPKDVYFVGNLAPPPSQDDDDELLSPFLREFRSKLSPVAFGAEVGLRPTADKIVLHVALRWNCYYRVFPRFEDQKEFEQGRAGAGSAAAEVSQEDSEEADTDGVGEDEEEIVEVEKNAPNPPVNLGRMEFPQHRAGRFMSRFRKVECVATSSVELIRKGKLLSVEIDPWVRAITTEIERAKAIVRNDPESFRIKSGSHVQAKVPGDALDSTAAYDEFLKSLDVVVVPNWSWKVRAEFKSGLQPGPSSILVEASNASEVDDSDPNIEGYFFDVGLRLGLTGAEPRPFEVELAPRNFRYSKDVWGRGFNCGVTRLFPPSEGYQLETVNAPIVEQPRYVTRIEPSAVFSVLSHDPLPTLEMVYSAMREYLVEWDAALGIYRESTPHWDDFYLKEFEDGRRHYETEIERFRKGIDLIRDEEDVRLAFKLTNDAFSRDPSRTTWRLFQLVFLVSQIPGIYALKSKDAEQVRDREIVDIIYFPTGGGKTEAYLATIVFHCFFDRLRGKTAGVTAWTRFPLRLLTVQQTQRVLDVIGRAELIRQANPDLRLSGPGIDGFAVGYFVGKEATPNDIPLPSRGGVPDPTWSIACDPKARQRWKRAYRCPSCRTSRIEVTFDPATVRVGHRCAEPNCAFPSGMLPLYVVDCEIYRYLPSVIVGTIDKLASIGNQRKVSLILGRVTGRCRSHGYYLVKCSQKGCSDPRDLVPGQPQGISPPTLLIQDELHLLKEGLGTFDSHYETFLQTLVKTSDDAPTPKIIASSATIEAFERQTAHLYGRTSRVFPGEGPTLGQSFYAKTIARPQRMFVGVIPHNKTLFNATLELIEFYHTETQRLRALDRGAPNPFGGSILPGTPEWTVLIDPFITMLAYFSALKDLDSIRTDLENAVDVDLSKAGIPGLRIVSLSGGSTTDEVSQTLDLLDSGPSSAAARPDTVLATNMISHGVDLVRLNGMLFYGMPRQTAEYIQASSRVGRLHIGLVFTCFKPERERDRSHFDYFLKYHEFLGQLIEPVAINRWAKFSIERTLPGLFTAILLQEIANKDVTHNPDLYYRTDTVKKGIGTGSIRAELFIPQLEHAYLVSRPVGQGEIYFRDQIRTRVRIYLDQILAAGPGTGWVSEALIPPPMNSLRQVDEVLKVRLDERGTYWARLR